METFSVLLALCEGNPPVIGKFPLQRPVSRSYDIFFDLRLNKRLSKRSIHRWFEKPSRSLWRHCNTYDCKIYLCQIEVHPLCLALLYPSDVIYWYLCKFNCWHKLNVHVHNLLMILGPHIKITHLKNILQQITDSVLYFIGFIFNCVHGMTQTVFRNTADYK